MNQIPLSPDDPRLTAYAFDEMAPAERAEFEQLLQRDPAARQAVEEIRAAGAMLADVLEHEPAVAEPMAGQPAAPKPAASNVVRFPQLYYMVSGLAAACFAVFFVYWQTNKPLHEKSKQYVQMELPPPPAPAAVAVALPVAVDPNQPMAVEATNEGDLSTAFAKKEQEPLALTAREQAGKVQAAARPSAWRRRLSRLQRWPRMPPMAYYSGAAS